MDCTIKTSVLCALMASTLPACKNRNGSKLADPPVAQPPRVEVVGGLPESLANAGLSPEDIAAIVQQETGAGQPRKRLYMLGVSDVYENVDYTEDAVRAALFTNARTNEARYLSMGVAGAGVVLLWIVFPPAGAASTWEAVGVFMTAGPAVVASIRGGRAADQYAQISVREVTDLNQVAGYMRDLLNNMLRDKEDVLAVLGNVSQVRLGGTRGIGDIYTEKGFHFVPWPDRTVDYRSTFVSVAPSAFTSPIRATYYRSYYVDKVISMIDGKLISKSDYEAYRDTIDAALIIGKTYALEGCGVLAPLDRRNNDCVAGSVPLPQRRGSEAEELTRVDATIRQLLSQSRAIVGEEGQGAYSSEEAGARTAMLEGLSALESRAGTLLTNGRAQNINGQLRALAELYDVVLELLVKRRFLEVKRPVTSPRTGNGSVP